MGWPALLSTVCPSLELYVFLFPGLVCPLEVSVSSGSIQVARGQTAVLPCTFTTNAALTNLNVIWMVIPLSNANQPQQVGLFLLEHVFPWDFPVLHPFLDVGPLQFWVYGCPRTSLSLHCRTCPLDLTWICFLQCFVNRCTLCPWLDMQLGQVYVILYCCPGPLVVCVFKRAQEI